MRTSIDSSESFEEAASSIHNPNMFLKANESQAKLYFHSTTFNMSNVLFKIT